MEVQAADQEEEAESYQAPSQPSILMRENEHSDKKTKVVFDVTKNIVKEFRKGDKIDTVLKKQSSGPKYKDETEEQLRPTKLRKTEDEPHNNKENLTKEVDQSENQHPNKVPGNKAKQAKKVDNSQIEELQKSQAVIKARDEMIMQSAPNNFY